MVGYVLYEQKAAVAYITLIDRTKEHLGSSDKVVIAMRRRLRESAVDLSAGKSVCGRALTASRALNLSWPDDTYIRERW